MNYRQEQKLLKEADKYIKENNIEAAKEVFDKVFENDTNYIQAVLLTESDPECSIFSKEFNKLLYTYYIDVLINKINCKL